MKYWLAAAVFLSGVCHADDKTDPVVDRLTKAFGGGTIMTADLFPMRDCYATPKIEVAGYMVHSYKKGEYDFNDEDGAPADGQAGCDMTVSVSPAGISFQAKFQKFHRMHPHYEEDIDDGHMLV